MHVLRPLYVVLGLVAIILAVRPLIVPKDFGIYERGYMFSWYRKANEEDWKNFKVKYQGKGYCQDCHGEQFQLLHKSPHTIIQCENFHGPAIEHPSEPQKLLIDRGRELCLRCHTALPYPTSKRAEIKGIDPDAHNPGLECSGCHDPHRASKPT
jgi:predicted CXXCH cytochrome family protein